MYFTGDNGYQIFLVFAPMLSSLTLDNNKTFTNWISSRENFTPFDTKLEPTMSSLASGKVILKFKNSVLVQKILLHCKKTQFEIYELSNWPHNSTYPLKIVYLVQSN